MPNSKISENSTPGQARYEFSALGDGQVIVKEVVDPREDGLVADRSDIGAMAPRSFKIIVNATLVPRG